jgi:FAD/FMN-containing dehydrogenase/Fe-S oxidoreductase
MDTTEHTFERHAAELAAAIEGDVRCDQMSRVLYSTDASIYQIMPLGVVLPKHAGDVATAVRWAASHGFPILPRGSGTSLGGQTVGAAMVLDFAHAMNRVLAVDLDTREARVQPGVILDELNAQLRPHRLQFAPDVATSNRASIGGMIGNNSCGAHSVVYGKTIDHVRALNVVLANGDEARLSPLSPDAWIARAGEQTPEGRLYHAISGIVERHREEIDRRFPHIMRRVAGYNLDRFVRIPADAHRSLADLVVGSEGTLAVVTEATLNLVPLPAHTAVAVVHFDDLLAALEATPEVLAFGPAAVELTDRTILDLTRANLEYARARTFLQGDPEAILAVEFAGASYGEVRERVLSLEARLAERRLGYACVRALEPGEQANVWRVRKAGLGLLMGIKGEEKPVGFVEDTAVAPERLADYARRFRAILDEHGAQGIYYGHASVGCLHIRPLLNLKRTEDVGRMRAIAEAVADLVHEFDGAMSAEHGDGLVRSEWLERMFGREICDAFRAVKAAFDPRGLMNPGKIVDPPRMTENLRFGPDYRTRPIGTHYDFSADGGFAGAVEMCSGIGACRKRTEGAMCPSYRATMEEAHVTRGRANALRAAISGRLTSSKGDPLAAHDLHAVLDLCLECKACKAECPSNVDMARLKSEFLAHYQTAHGVSLRARLFGHIATLNRLGCGLAPLSNWLLNARPHRALLQRFLGIDARRPLPPFARPTFAAWFDGRKAAPGSRHPAPSPDRPAGSRVPGAGCQTVALLDDTFMNTNEPQVGIAAVRVLEAMDLHVCRTGLPCCGRPLISKGLLTEAKRLAAENIPRLARFAQLGIPVIGCEPSCLLTLRDEYPALVPGPEANAVAANAFLLEEFLARRAADGLPLPAFRDTPRRLLLHGHCHQRALAGMASALTALRLPPGFQIEETPAGCCGMAGSFGYETEHYDLSLKIGEDRVLPAVRAADPEVTIVAAGTSCRQQIAHATGRRALHPAEVLAEALEGSPEPAARSP